MAMAGVHHITIAPGLLKELAEKEAKENKTVSLFDEAPEGLETSERIDWVVEQKKFRIRFVLSLGGEGERKLGQVRDVVRKRKRVY